MEDEFQNEILKRFARSIYGGGLGGASRTNNPEADAFLKMYLDFVDNRDDYLK